MLSAMRDEIAALDFIWMTYLLFGLLGLLVAVWTQLGLRGLQLASPEAPLPFLGAAAAGEARSIAEATRIVVTIRSGLVRRMGA